MATKIWKSKFKVFYAIFHSGISCCKFTIAKDVVHICSLPHICLWITCQNSTKRKKYTMSHFKWLHFWLHKKTSLQIFFYKKNFRLYKKTSLHEIFFYKKNFWLYKKTSLDEIFFFFFIKRKRIIMKFKNCITKDSKSEPLIPKLNPYH